MARLTAAKPCRGKLMMRVEFTCLCCRKQYIKHDHSCSLPGVFRVAREGGACTAERHVDFCRRCGGFKIKADPIKWKEGSIILSFEKIMDEGFSNSPKLVEKEKKEGNG